MPQIRFGDLVRLNSGGAEMIVVNLDPTSGTMTTAWRNPDGSVHEMSVASVCLTFVGRRWSWPRLKQRRR